MGLAKRKNAFEHEQKAHSSRACANSHPDICPPFTHVVPNGSYSGKPRPQPDSADTQADIGLHRSYMPEDTLSHGTAPYKNIKNISSLF